MGRYETIVCAGQMGRSTNRNSGKLSTSLNVKTPEAAAAGTYVHPLRAGPGIPSPGAQSRSSVPEHGHDLLDKALGGA